MIRRPPRSTLFPTRRSSDLRQDLVHVGRQPDRSIHRIGRTERREAILADEVHAHELAAPQDRKSTRLNSSHGYISYAVFCLKKKIKTEQAHTYMKRGVTTQS